MHKAKLLSSEGGKARHIFFRPTPKKTLQNQLLIRVSSNKKRSFCEKKMSLPFRFIFAFRLLAKNAKFLFNLFCEKIRNFRKIENVKISRKNSVKILQQICEKKMKIMPKKMSCKIQNTLI